MSLSFLERLYHHLRQSPLERKTIIANSFAEGRQWLERISRKHGPVLNCTVETIDSLARKHSAWQLGERGIRAASEQELFWMVYEIMREMSAAKDAYVPESLLTPGVVRAFQRTADELRHAGINSGDLTPAMFAEERRGIYIIDFLKRYERELQLRNRTDRAGLTEFAEAARKGSRYFIHEHVTLTAMQRRMLRKLAGDELVVLKAGPPFAESGCSANESEFFRAAGRTAEVQEAFRRMAQRGIAWDQAELIVSDYGRYVTAIHSLTVREGIACTYSGGLPLELSMQGRAAKLYLAWIKSNYSTDLLSIALRHGLIRVEDVPAAAAAGLLEQSGIGWGRKRNAAWIESANRTEDEQTRKTARWLAQLLADLPETLTPGGILRGLVCFLERDVPCLNEEEREVLSDVRSIAQSAGDCTSMKPAAALRFAEDALSRISCQVRGNPEAGHLYVSALQDGGISGRPHTFILGMNEDAWTTATAQDPILLDEERRAISPELPDSSMIAAMRLAERDSRLSSIGGCCTFSCCSYELADNKEAFPAYAMLQMYRRASGEKNADFADLLRETGTVRSIRLRAKASYPHLERGAAAIAARSSPDVTVYDGLLQTDGDPVLPSIGHLSVSRMEQFGRCPLKFFFSTIIGAKPKETARFDRTRWLDAVQRGSLLHEIYGAYYKALQQRLKDGMIFDHDQALLDQLTTHITGTYIDTVPAPSPRVREQECESIRRDIEVFWLLELAGTQHAPKYLEYCLHEDGKPLLVRIAGDIEFPLQGVVDRVDEIAPHQYRITDYKTGGSRAYREQDCFSGGKQLQHAIYAAAVEQKLRQSGEDPQAVVTEARYLFPTCKGLGSEVLRKQDRRSELADLLRHMLRAMNDGTYPPTDEPRLCTFCEYREVCGPHAAWMKEKAERPDNQAALASVKAVRGHG